MEEDIETRFDQKEEKERVLKTTGKIVTDEFRSGRCMI